MSENPSESSYDEEFLRWVVDLSHATLRDAEHTLAFPSALVGVLLFVLGTQMEHFLPSSGCPDWLYWVTWPLLLAGMATLGAAVYTIVSALHGDIYGEIRLRDGNGNFISDEATQATNTAERCRQLALYRALLDCNAERVLTSRGSAYIRTMTAIALFLAARLVTAAVGC